MADVQPLHGIRYASEAVADLAQVMTPPFDVISPEAQARYYARSPYNFVRLELSEGQPGDTTLNNRYTRAARSFSEWRSDGVLRQDSQAGYYLYQQSFTYGQQHYVRTGLLARVRLEPWSERVILPHEYTLSKPKDDRLNLMRACAANFSPLMGWYDDPQARIRHLLTGYTSQPEVLFSDEAHEEHRLQPITNEDEIRLIQNFFAERQLYIADGHHRYETALNYREEVRAQRKQLDLADSANFAMMVLIDTDDPGLLVLPTHRMLSGLTPSALEALSSERFARYFTVRELPASEPAERQVQQLTEAGKDAPAFVIKTAAQAWLLNINEQGRSRMAESEHTPAWNALDVAIAHRLVVEELLGLSAADVAGGNYIRYTHNLSEALEALPTGEAQALILLNSTPVRQVCDVAQADDRMPQKSTYLYPKLGSGLVINPLW